MNFSRILKFTCSGALLAAGIYAYADGEVTLNGGKVIGWTEFVNAINTPSTVKGTLPAGADADLEAAKDAVGPLETAVTTAQGVVDEKKKLVAEGSTLYTDSVNAETTLAGYQNSIEQKNQAIIQAKENIVTAAKNAYETKEAQLAGWNTQMTELNNTLVNLTGQSTALTGEIDDENEALESLQKQYDALGKETEQITTTVITAKWLDEDNKAAQAFKTAYGTGLVQKNPNALVYYNYLDYESTKDEDYKGSEIIYLSFVPVDGLASITAKNFFTTFGKTNSTKPVQYLFVYLGEQYEDGYDGYMLVENYTAGANNTIVTSAVNAISDLAKSPEYSKTTVSYKTTYDDPDKEEELRGQISAQELKISGLRTQRQTVNGNITTTRTSMTTTQGLIDGYTKVPEGSAAGTLSEQAQLKKAWDDAAAGDFSSDYIKTTYATDLQKISDFESEINGLNDLIDGTDEKEGAQAAVNKANAAIAAARQDVTDAEAGVTEAEAKVTAAKQKVTEEEGKLAQAQADADAAEVQKYYDITLNADVTADAAINKAFNGTIWGEGHIINVETETPFINGTFSGQLSNAAINGKFAKSVAGSTIDMVAVWDGASNSRYYDESGKAAPYTNILNLGYAVRDDYGIDFANNGKLVPLTDNSKVYSLTVYNHDKTTRQSYVLVNAAKTLMTSATTSLELPVNTFAESATEDIAALELANVFYGENHDCAKVDITDGQNFYSPVDIAAAAVSYARQYKAGMNTVCLPFAVSTNLSSSLSAVCKYDREADKTFWFTKVADGEVIPANTPVLLLGKSNANNFTLDIPSNTTIKKTESFVVKSESTDADDKSECFGNLKRVSVSEFAGEYEAQAGNMYGLSDGSFKYAGPNATFPAFRMVIKRNTAAPVMNAPMHGAPSAIIEEYGIGIRDENGKDITEELLGQSTTTGIEEAAVPALEIVGGQGEISITSEANYGKVQIFTVDGRVAASANVVEGTTTVSLAHGLYIVMGQKVLVK